MIIEYELIGTKCVHKGLFDTTGFWLRHEPQMSGVYDVGIGNELIETIEGWKLYSHCAFSYYHEDKNIVDLVYSRLISVLRGATNIEMDGIGCFRRINK